MNRAKNYLQQRKEIVKAVDLAMAADAGLDPSEKADLLSLLEQWQTGTVHGTIPLIIHPQGPIQHAHG